MVGVSLFDAPEVLVPMTVVEARECADAIKAGIHTVGRKLLELYERDGWQALGYASWRECAQAEFGFRQSRVYQLLSAAEVERNLSTIVENLPESHARPLTALPPDVQREVYGAAIDSAPNGKVTAAHVASVVAQRSMAVHYSSEDLTWETPQDLFDLLDAEFGFTLDVCAVAPTAKCERFFTPEEDGLAQDWRGHICWMNPPYGDQIPHWMEKASEAAQDAVVVCLVPARTDTLWWWNSCLAGEIRFLKGRLKFRQDAQSEPTSAPFPSAVVVLGPGVNPQVLWWDWKHDLYL
jgi:phage N-6-adenine-methyltransferase